MGSVVEAELALLEEQREAVPRDAIVFAQHPFGLVPEVLDAVDMASATRELHGVVDAHMAELAHVQRIVAAEAVGVDPAVRCYFPLDYRHQRGGFGVVHDLGIRLPTTLEQAEHEHLAGGAATALALADAPEVALVQFDGAIEHLVLDPCQLVGDQPP